MSWIRKTTDGAFETAELIVGGIIPIGLIIIGTIGNLLCVNYLLQRKTRQTRSAYIYLIFLCLSDTLSLYQWNFDYIVMIIGNRKSLTVKSLFLCRSIAFLSFYTLHLSVIFLTFVSIDRTLAIWSRTYRFHLTKRRRASIIALIVMMILFIIDGFLLSFGIINNDTNEIICYRSCNNKLMNFYENIYPMIHLIIMYIIPFVIMILGMILILIKVFSHRFESRHSRRKQHLLFMLVGMCLIYMILTLPNRLCFSVFLSRLLNHIYTDTVLLSSNTLLYTRNATNILFLYMSSNKFRKYLANICCFTCRWSTTSRVLPTQLVQMI